MRQKSNLLGWQLLSYEKTREYLNCTNHQNTGAL